MSVCWGRLSTLKKRRLLQTFDGVKGASSYFIDFTQGVLVWRALCMFMAKEARSVPITASTVEDAAWPRFKDLLRILLISLFMFDSCWLVSLKLYVPAPLVSLGRGVNLNMPSQLLAPPLACSLLTHSSLSFSLAFCSWSVVDFSTIST